MKHRLTLSLAIGALVAAAPLATAQDFEDESWWDSTEVEDRDWGDQRGSDWDDDFDDTNWENDPWRTQDTEWGSQDRRNTQESWQRQDQMRDRDFRDRQMQDQDRMRRHEPMRGTDWQDDMRRDRYRSDDDRQFRDQRDFGQDRGIGQQQRDFGQDRRYDQGGQFRSFGSDSDLSVSEDDYDDFNMWYEEDN